MKYFALVTRGLEDVAAQDLEECVGNIRIIEKEYKRIVFEYDGDPKNLLHIKSADDIFCYVDSFGVGHQRASLQAIQEKVLAADFSEALEMIQKVRSFSWALSFLSFSVSVSSVGKKNYTPIEIKSTLVEWISESFGRTMLEDGSQDLNIRVFIEKEYLLLGVRLAAHPLHRRDYKTVTLPGSLKPSVAYGMLRIAGIKKTDIMLDPLCGVGTIPLEAIGMTTHIIAGDSNKEALDIAQGSIAGSWIAFHQRDARKLPLEAPSIDAIVTNLPFWKQIGVEEIESFLAEIMQEFARILKKGGRMVLLTTHGDLISALAIQYGLTVISSTEISLFWLTPHIVHITL